MSVHVNGQNEKVNPAGQPRIIEQRAPTTPSPRRVRVHVPAHDGWPESVRGVGSEVVCVKCGARLRGRSHAEARKALRFHRLDGCA